MSSIEPASDETTEVRESAIGTAIEQAKSFLHQKDAVAAESCLIAQLALAPKNSEVLRLLGIAQSMQERYVEAVRSLQQAIALQPEDPLAHNSLGNALGNSGDNVGAAMAFAKACDLADDFAPAWYNYAKALCKDLRNDAALPVLRHAVTVAPEDLRTRFLYAYTLRVTGYAQEASDEYRKILELDPNSGEAWLGSANLKNMRFDTTDVAEMERIRARELSPEDEISIRFALARGYEDMQRHDDAFHTYVDDNARVRHLTPWDAAHFSDRTDAFLDAFALPSSPAPNAQGGEVIFIVSLPRSGSSLIEQILASHPQIDGAGELTDLPAVLEEESQCRGQNFPDWVKDTSAAQWQQLGERYLERTARWRRERGRFTDKLPENWRYIGAAIAMLPSARIVICRRDPLETALACFRQLFSQVGQAFSYDLVDIAAYWRDFDRTARHWQTLYPSQIREQSYERLLADTENQVRELLTFCGLNFDERCMQFYETKRIVRTASASQVRQPLVLNVTMFCEGVALKFAPVILTSAPTGADVGVTAVNVGSGRVTVTTRFGVALPN